MLLVSSLVTLNVVTLISGQPITSLLDILHVSCGLKLGSYYPVFQRGKSHTAVMW